VPKPKKQSRTDWGDVAEWYDQLVGESGSEYHREVVLPGVLKLLSLKPGERFVDIACGQGVLCRIARERGAETTGVDAAEPLIRAARERGPADIHYHVSDARDGMPFLPAAHFNAAACVLAIQNIHPIQPLFDGIARVLAPGGRCVVVMMHPCFRGPKETSWGWDDTKRVQYRRVDRYLIPRKTPIVTHPGKTSDIYTWTFHKPIAAYVNAVSKAGMLIDAIEEWPSHRTSNSGPRAAAENIARKEIPMFLVIRSLKTEPRPRGTGLSA
jgi:ubiquinone/menaquinone biosynthesis C-methylase UbiE